MPKAKIKKARGGQTAKKILRKSSVFTLHDDHGEVGRMSPGSWQVVVDGIRNKHGNFHEAVGELRSWAEEEGLETLKNVLADESQDCE